MSGALAALVLYVVASCQPVVEAQTAERLSGARGGVAQEHDQSTRERGAPQQERAGVQGGDAQGGAAQENEMTTREGTGASPGHDTTGQGNNASHDALGRNDRNANGTSSGCDEEKERNRTSHDNTQNETRVGMEIEDRGEVAAGESGHLVGPDEKVWNSVSVQQVDIGHHAYNASMGTENMVGGHVAGLSNTTASDLASPSAGETTVSSLAAGLRDVQTQSSSSAGPGDAADESIVSGSLVLSMLDPNSFSIDPVARLAVRNAVADLANVTHELVDLSLRTERRLSFTNSSTSGVNGSVLASYWIAVATSRIAASISDHIASMPLPEITTLCQRQLNNSDLNVTVTVVAKATHVHTEDTHGNRNHTRTNMQNHTSFLLGGERLTVQPLNLTATGNLRGSSSVDVVRSGVWMFPFAAFACAIGMAFVCCGFRLHYRMKRLETQVIVIGETHERRTSYRSDFRGKETVVAGAIMNGPEKVVNGAPVSPTWAWSP